MQEYSRETEKEEEWEQLALFDYSEEQYRKLVKHDSTNGS